MRPFLYQVASLFYERYREDISQLAFIFPNRRAGLFFQKYLSGIVGKPLFSPAILTIEDLFIQLSGKRLADRIRMLFLLYESYIRRSGSTEGFDEFLYWGEMLLNDFDDIDKYMANARLVFSYVKDLREIENEFSFLSEAQIAAIRTFWSSFYPKQDSPNQREFLAVWQVLYGLYEEFKKRLAEENSGYEGMIFREVVERLEQGEKPDLPYEKVVFVGLNALSTAEERFLIQLRKRGIADFYWDYISDKVCDPENRASYFLARNRKNFPSDMELPREEQKKKPRIKVIGIPSGIGQAKQAYALLDEWCDQLKMNPEESLRTAVVLPDELLLIPVLNAIPARIRSINVTMGYPLSGTPVTSLVEYIMALQRSVRHVDREPVFYYRDVLPLLNHRYILATDPEIIPTLVEGITRNNRIYISQADLGRTPFLTHLFTPTQDIEAFMRYLIRLLAELNEWIQEDKLASEFLFHYYTAANRMREVMQKSQVEMRLDTFFRLLKRMAGSIKIPFRGEPLSGLQIMGALETRALDFDRLIILSMNEGVFPRREAANSFIPYNLRKGFGLPTYEHQDSIWAYHFYRLVERASEVCLLYDTRSDGARTGEVSRFAHQLRYHYEMPLRDQLVVYNVSTAKTPALSIPKGKEVMRRLDAFRRGGNRTLSASALNTYLDCPLSFYFSVVEGIREEESVSETVESDVFGSILHNVMERIYAPLCGKKVSADLLRSIRSDSDSLKTTVEEAFASEFFKTRKVRPLTGQNFLIGEMIRKYVAKILERDTQLTPFTYRQSEQLIHAHFPLSDGSDIRLKGFIDRVDTAGGSLRIVDYKSGQVTTSFDSVEGLFDPEKGDRAKAVMQVFLYGWMFTHSRRRAARPVQPAIYNVRSLFAGTFDPAIYHRVERGKYARVDDFADYAEPFEEELRGCLDSIFDRSTPFTQTPTGGACPYCAFRSLCGR